MPIQVLTIPFDPQQEGFQDEDVRKFLLNKRINTLRPEFFQLHGKAYWSVFVDYEIVTPEASDRNLRDLNEPQQLLFQRFREWRKEQAEKDGFPVFLIATNSELLQLVKQAPRSLAALRQIRGFGKKKLVRYGQAILDLIAAFYDAAPDSSAPGGGQDAPHTGGS